MSRINQFIASQSGLSRRAADKLVEDGKILVNGKVATVGQQVADNDEVTSSDPGFEFSRLGNQTVTNVLIALNKPTGYVCSRKGQGSKTIYELLPGKYKSLKPVGRLDKDSSGLLLMTNNGQLANELTHPRYQK